MPKQRKISDGVLLVHVVPGGAPLLLSRGFLKDLGCHIDLNRGHLFFEKVEVRAVVTSEQSPHFAPPTDMFWSTRIRSWLKSSRVSALTNVQCIVPFSTARNKTKYIRGSPQHLTANHQKLPASTLHLSMARMDRTNPPCDEARDYWENREGTMGESTWHRQTDAIRPNA